MKRYIKNIAALLLAASVCGCSEFEELDNNAGGYTPAPGETIKLVLNADKGEADVTPETRVFVGKTEGGKVTYYWNDGDQIGIVPLDMSNKSPNYVTEEVNINSSNKNEAQFAAYITGDDYNSQEPKLLIYYPFNESMLEGAKDTNGNFKYSTGKDFVSQHGLRFRLPQLQEQYGYSRTYTGHAAKDVNEHPSVWSVSNYGLAYDLAKSTITKDIETGHTDVTATGRFSLDHANTYFQFNVYGTQSPGGKNYADGTWKVASVSIEAGNCSIGTGDDGETTYTLTDKVALAGTYTLKYDYNANHFSGESVNDYGNNDQVNLTATSTVTSVKVNMNNIAEAPVLKNNAKEGVPAFAVINPLGIKENAMGTLNCLKVAVMCYKYDDKGNIVASDTRTRYYNIESIAGKDISGSFYSIDFEVCDPVESYSDLSVTGTANCYIISAPGNYSFNANVAGNGQLPYSTTTTTTSLGVDPTNLLQDDVNYGIDWLWASGISFDQIKEELGISSNSVSLSGDDAENVVAKILNGVELSGKTGQISIGFAAGTSVETLSGNIVLALYKVNANGTAGDIVWTWHMWLGSPNTHHYKFPATNAKWQFTNEDWYMMDRNIGAETEELSNPRSTGLFYQRSRKEPMIGWGDSSGSDTWTSNQLPTYRNTNVFGDIAQWTSKTYTAVGTYGTLKYPMALVTGYGASTQGGDYYYCWNASESAVNDITNNTKSMYDPCPVGYRMPTTREWDNLKNDVYQHQGGVKGTGVFGYCQWEELATVAKDLNDERIIEYLAHIAGGDYYTINEDFEREYHITKNSGTGKEIITRFPNTGLLRGNGNWMYYNEDSYTTEIVETTHPAGPELTATINSTGGGSYTIQAPKITTDITTTTSGNTTYLQIDLEDTDATYKYTTRSSTSAANGTNLTKSGDYYRIRRPTSTTTYYIYKQGETSSEWSNYTTITVTVSGTRYTYKYENGQEKNITKATTYTLNVAFTNNGSYSYATSASGSKTSISGETFSIDCSRISYSSNKATYYFYSTNNGVISAATQITITRSGTSSSYSYTVATPVRGSEYTETSGGEFVSNSSASMALWSSGRVYENGEFTTSWYGFGICPDGWSQKTTSGEWGQNGTGSSPYQYDDKRTFCISYGPNQLGIYSGDNSPATNTYPAIPIRCIREYDNTSTATVAE